MGLTPQAVYGAAAFFVVGGILWRHKVQDAPERWRPRIDLGTVLLSVGLSAIPVAQTVSNATIPRPWDFPIFYTAAVAASQGSSFYDPAALAETFAEVEQTWDVPSDWLVEVGFWYPPPTALYLAPLGFLSFPVAVIINGIIQSVFFVASIALLHRFYPLRAGPMGFVEMAVLGLLFRPVLSAFRLSQIVFGALLLLVIATTTLARSSWLGGLVLGVGTIFKPVLLIPAVLALSIQRWRLAVGALLGLVASAVTAAFIFGFDVFEEFLAHGPADRTAQLALHPVIQSLNSELRRIFQAEPSGPGAIRTILYPPYLIAAALLTLITIVLMWKTSKADRWMVPSFALGSLLALIVYPNTLYNTLPLMLPALIAMAHQSDDLGIPPRVTVAVIATVYGLIGIDSRLGFIGLMVGWTAVAAAILRALRRAQPILGMPLERGSVGR